MALVKTKIQNSLDESRILILGTQVLLGFQYRAVFEPGFDKLSQAARLFELAGLGLLVVSLALLMSPIPFHQVSEGGDGSSRLNDLASMVMGWALLPFALALGASLFIVLEQFNPIVSVVASTGTLLTTMFFWYGIGMVGRRKVKSEASNKEPTNEPMEDPAPDLTDRTRSALTEARMVLPGAQAMLGFQTIIILGQEFDSLPASSKYLHLASLLMTALATILLMAPAAYHCIAEHGEDSESIYRLTSQFVIASMVPLALGITGDLVVIIRKVTDSLAAGTIGGLLALILMYGLWFGYTLLARKQLEAASENEGTIPSATRG